jgi:glutathione S-transferase
MTAACANRLFHAALPAEWAAAQAPGRYEMSTRGRTLADEGFIHASYESQVEGVANRFYADLDELVLLEIDRERIDVEVIDESPTGDPADEHFPHLYGPLRLDAVRAATTWRRVEGEPWRLPDARDVGPKTPSSGDECH